MLFVPDKVIFGVYFTILLREFDSTYLRASKQTITVSYFVQGSTFVSTDMNGSPWSLGAHVLRVIKSPGVLM